MSDVWVLGSAAWDQVYEIDHIPTVGGRAVATYRGRRPGGSTANVARALASAGHHVGLVTQLGADDVGHALLDELATWGIDTDEVLRSGTSTPEALIFLDRNTERTIVVLDKGRVASIPVPHDALASADAVFLGRYADYEPGLAGMLRSSSALVATAVPSPEDDWFAHIVVGSASEYPSTWLAGPHEALRDRVGDQLRYVVVTHGRLGATIYGDQEPVPIPAVKALVADVTGAGDSFAAGLLHGLLQGSDVATAGRLGAFWAAAALPLTQSVPPPWEQLGLGTPMGNWASVLAEAGV